MTSLQPLTMESTTMVVPWEDPVVDSVGFDVRSTYVELFWLGILGPTALWITRRLVTGFGRYPYGYEVEMADMAACLGLGFTRSTNNPFMRSLERCVMFGVAQPIDGALAVRRRLPPVAQRHLARMPPTLRETHATWRHDCPSGDQHERSRVLAEAMIAAGDDPQRVEQQLVMLGIDATLAADATGRAMSRGFAPYDRRDTISSGA